MDIRKLKTPSFIHPLWIKKVLGNNHECTVGSDCRVNLCGEVLSFVDSPFPVGSVVVVWVSDFAWCALKEDYERDIQEKKQKAEQQKKDELLKEAQKIETARGFHASLSSLPFRYSVGIKDNICGLSESSMGNGCKKNTVIHLVLDESISLGKIKRNEGDFLCSSSNSKNGRRWSGNCRIKHSDCKGEEYLPIITCKSCMSILKKLCIL